MQISRKANFISPLFFETYRSSKPDGGMVVVVETEGVSSIGNTGCISIDQRLIGKRITFGLCAPGAVALGCVNSASGPGWKPCTNADLHLNCYGGANSQEEMALDESFGA